MSDTKMQRKQTVLTADGELQDVETPVSEIRTVYCIHCGTANRSIATFCRNCGQSLDEELDNPTGAGRKPKHLSEETRIPIREMTVPMMVFSLIKVVVVGAVVTVIVTSTGNFGAYVLAGGFILGWIITEAAHYGIELK